MTTEDDKGTSGSDEPMFTRAQFAREVAKQVRSKVDAALAEYGDLEELRGKAAEADKNRTQLDKIEQALAAMQQRAEQAERDTMVREVADELGVPMRLARKFSGKTKAELLADGRETMEELGIEPGKGKNSKTSDKTNTGETDETDEVDEQQVDEIDEEQQVETPPRRPARTSRPRENLRSGAPHTPGTPEETDPMKLAALVPRRG